MTTMKLALTGFHKADERPIWSKIDNLKGSVKMKNTGDKFSDRIDALIVDQVSQTDKLMTALAAGIPILDKSYVKDSHASGSWLNFDSYDLGDSRFEAKCKQVKINIPPLEDRIRIRKEGGVFKDWKVVMLIENETRRAKFVQQIQIGGGECIKWTARHLVDASDMDMSRITHILTEPSVLKRVDFGRFLESKRDSVLPGILGYNYITHYLTKFPCQRPEQFSIFDEGIVHHLCVRDQMENDDIEELKALGRKLNPKNRQDDGGKRRYPYASSPLSSPTSPPSHVTTPSTSTIHATSSPSPFPASTPHTSSSKASHLSSPPPSLTSHIDWLNTPKSVRRNEHSSTSSPHQYRDPRLKSAKSPDDHPKFGSPHSFNPNLNAIKPPRSPEDSASWASPKQSSPQVSSRNEKRTRSPIFDLHQSTDNRRVGEAPLEIRQRGGGGGDRESQGGNLTVRENRQSEDRPGKDIHSQVAVDSDSDDSLYDPDKPISPRPGTRERSILVVDLDEEESDGDECRVVEPEKKKKKKEEVEWSDLWWRDEGTKIEPSYLKEPYEAIMDQFYDGSDPILCNRTLAVKHYKDKLIKAYKERHKKQ